MPLPKPTERERELEARLAKCLAFIQAQCDWEAMVLNDDGPWFDQMPEEIRQRFDEVQNLRIEAMDGTSAPQTNSHRAAVVLPIQWRALLAIAKIGKDTPEPPVREDGDEKNRDPTPYRMDQRTIPVNFPSGPDCIWMDICLCSVDHNYYLGATLFDDGHEVDCDTFNAEEVVIRVCDGVRYIVTTSWENPEVQPT